MTLLQNAEIISPGKLREHAQLAWERQSRYVAENSDFFRYLWDGKQPPKRLRDLPELPLSDKSQLRISQAEHRPFGNYLGAPASQAVRLHRTSGTTGQAMNLALSARDCEITEIVGGRAQRLAGLRPDDIVAHCLNYQMWMGGLTDHLTLEKTGAMVVPFGVGSTRLLIDTIRQVGINAISCTPSYPAVIEKALAEHFPQLEPRDLGLKLGLFGGEAALDDLVARDEEVVIYCQGPRCLRSSKAAGKAVSWGFTKVYYFRGGFPAWKIAEYPFDTD